MARRGHHTAFMFGTVGSRRAKRHLFRRRLYWAASIWAALVAFVMISIETEDRTLGDVVTAVLVALVPLAAVRLSVHVERRRRQAYLEDQERL